MKKVITASNYEVIPLDLRTNVRFYTSVDFGILQKDDADIWHVRH